MRFTAITKLLAETRSVTAVEFALIGPVLFLFVFCILLMGVVQFWQLTLDDAVRYAAREVSVGAGSTTTGDHSGSDFVSTVCAEFGLAAPNCSSGLQYAVQGAPTFTGTGGITPATLSSTGVLSQSSAFSGVAVSEPVLVLVAYKIPISIPLVPMSLVTLNGTSAILATVATVAEP